jgi:hypothetical protein
MLRLVPLPRVIPDVSNDVFFIFRQLKCDRSKRWMQNDFDFPCNRISWCRVPRSICFVPFHHGGHHLQLNFPSFTLLQNPTCHFAGIFYLYSLWISWHSIQDFFKEKIVTPKTAIRHSAERKKGTSISFPRAPRSILVTLDAFHRTSTNITFWTLIYRFFLFTLLAFTP